MKRALRTTLGVLAIGVVAALAGCGSGATESENPAPSGSGGAPAQSQSPAPAALAADESAMVKWYADHVDELGRLVKAEDRMVTNYIDDETTLSDLTDVAADYKALSDAWYARIDGQPMGGSLTELERLWATTMMSVGEVGKVLSEALLNSASADEVLDAGAGLGQAKLDLPKMRTEIERLQGLR